MIACSSTRPNEVKNSDRYSYTYHVLPDRVLALQVGRGVLPKAVGNQLRDGGLWVVGAAVGEVVAGESVLFGLNNTELNPGVVVTAVSTGSLDENCSLSVGP